MPVQPLNSALKPVELSLDQIFLDPNNPRFVGHDWQIVPDDEIDQEHHQEKARSRLLREFGADKLRANMEINGYLPIDRIIVRQIKPSQYVVLEGNRRIAAAKTIGKYSSSGETVHEQVLQSLEKIPALLYEGSDKQASWIFQGLRHITGISDWSAYNKARLLVEQMESEGLSLTEVGKRFGLTSFGAGQWVRGYHGFRQAKSETSYAVEVDERFYPYIQELFGRSSIAMREWLEWNESEKRFKNIDRLDEFVGWFYPRPNSDDALDQGNLPTGEWDNRHIGKRDDIRQLAYLIESSLKNFELFRSKHDLEDAYGKAIFEAQEQKIHESKDASEKVLNSIKVCTKSLETIPHAMLKMPELKVKLDQELTALKSAIAFVSE